MSEQTTQQGRKEFLIKEYELLFVRNEQAQQNRWNFMQPFIIAISAFYFALFNRNIGLSKSPSLNFIVWFPVFMSIFGGMLSWGLRIGMEQRGLVMAEIEKHFEAPGWESLRDSVKGNTGLPSPLTSINYLFWIVATFASTWIALSAINGRFLPTG